MSSRREWVLIWLLGIGFWTVVIVAGKIGGAF